MGGTSSCAASTPNRFASTEPSAFTFISPKPGSASILRRSSVAVASVAPEALGVAVVLVGDERAQLLRPARHARREAVDRGPLAEDLLEPGRVGSAIARRIERAEPLLQLQRPGERRLHGHLLVEREADQQRERLVREQLVRFASPVKWSASGTPRSY